MIFANMCNVYDAYRDKEQGEINSRERDYRKIFFSRMIFAKIYRIKTKLEKEVIILTNGVTRGCSAGQIPSVLTLRKCGLSDERIKSERARESTQCIGKCYRAECESSSSSSLLKKH